MASWSRDKVDSADLNNGNQYGKGDRVSREQLNAMVNAGLYAQDFAEHLADAPDLSEVANVGTPSVSFVNNVKNGKTYKKLKFSNLKGETGRQGQQGVKGDTATIRIGTVETVVPTQPAKVTNSGTTTDAIFNFQIPQGRDGVDGKDGMKGDAGTISIGTVTTVAPTQPASVTNSGTSTDAIFNFNIPKGEKGEIPVIDTALSSTSTNPVQNKVITEALGNKVSKTDEEIKAPTLTATSGLNCDTNNVWFGGVKITSYERTEIIYDMDTKNTINGTAYSSGIPLYNGLNIVHDFSGFKKYDFVYEPCQHPSNWFGSARTITIHDAIVSDGLFTYFDCVSPSNSYAQQLLGVQLYTQFRLASDKQSVKVISSVIGADGSFSYVNSGYGDYYRLIRIVGYK